jgi:hypothetical protein
MMKNISSTSILRMDEPWETKELLVMRHNRATEQQNSLALASLSNSALQAPATPCLVFLPLCDGARCEAELALRSLAFTALNLALYFLRSCDLKLEE